MPSRTNTHTRAHACMPGRRAPTTQPSRHIRYTGVVMYLFTRSSGAATPNGAIEVYVSERSERNALCFTRLVTIPIQDLF